MSNLDTSLPLKSHFPFFTHNSGVTYLDNAATTQICQPALDAINHYYQFEHSNVHRASHKTAKSTTNQFEAIRKKTAKWLNADDATEIIWTKGATEASNLLAHCLTLNCAEGDEVIVSVTDHHANFVVWQQLCLKHNLTLNVLDITPNMTIDLAHLKRLISSKTKIVALPHVANATGVIQPIEDAIQIIKSNSKADVIIDGAQAINHLSVDVQALNCDFYFFSTHKMFAGTGLGVLWGKATKLNTLSPYHFGGEMVKEVSIETSSFNALPFKFEAGTPNIASVFALGATLDFFQSLNLIALREHEKKIQTYLLTQLNQLDNIELIATQSLAGAVAFTLTNWHAYDAASLLTEMNIAIRVGQHCAMPLHHAISQQSTLRVSISMYTDTQDIDNLINALHALEDFL